MKQVHACVGNGLQSLNRRDFEFEDKELSGRLQNLKIDELKEVVQKVHDFAKFKKRWNSIHLNHSNTKCRMKHKVKF